MKKKMAILLALAMIIAILPCAAFAAYEPAYTSAELAAMGETVFTAPDPGNTSIADQPVADYWDGWSTDNTYGTANYKYYSQFGDYVVQFYRDGKSTTLGTDVSFFPNAQSGSGIARLIAPSGGYGAGMDFIVLNYNFKVGDVNTCYQDYYFKDIDGKVIAAVRYDINGMAVATSSSDIENIGSYLDRSDTASQPFSFMAWNNGGTYSVSLEKDGECIYTNTYDGEFNGFGSLDVVSGYYNNTYTHTAIGSLEITVGLFGEVSAERALNSLTLPYNLEDGYSLPETVLGKEISWSDEIIAGDTTEYKTITASIDGLEKVFEVMIMGKNDSFVAAYTKNGAMPDEKSLHLALKTEEGWQELNFGIGVLFAEAELEDGTVAGTTKVLKKPYLYRTDSGSIGVAAKTMTVGGVEDSGLTLWETDDLVSYVRTGTAETVEGYEITSRITADGISGDVSSILPVTSAEADYLLKKLGEVTNTGVDPINISTAVGSAVLELPDLTAYYSDGTTEEIPVIWNENQLSEIDFSKPGIYTVTGEAAVKDYASPLIYGRADPVIYQYNGKYYFIATDETDSKNRNIYLRSADSIEGLADAADVSIFTGAVSGDTSGCNWAPELHEIGGSLYCLFASSTTGSWDAVQSRVMKCSGDPMEPASWEYPVRVTRNDGSALTEGGITLDMTYFEANGKSYYCWAQRPIADGVGNSELFIAEIDPADPYRLKSEPVKILSPKYAWDRQNTTVDEGPNVLQHDGKLYMTFSGDSVSNYYCLGLLAADEDADLLDPASWKETGYPVLASAHVSGEYGPGHNSFTADEYGRDVIVFHMKPNGGTRSASVRTIHYSFDGTPIFYMTADRYLKEEYRTVTATITVRDSGMSDDEFEVASIANNLKLYDCDNVRGHITLPTEKDGAEIVWSSDNSAITPDGIVTRGESDTAVKLTAAVTKNGVTAYTYFDMTVKAKKELDEKVGYIYAYFRGSVNGEQEVQQIHLAISEDGLNWRDLNGNFPVLESTMGTKGVRDPYIIRSYEGDRFYLMATDLDSNGGDWAEYANNGSKYLMFWESDDLVNWSEQRMIQVSDDSMSCTWAPEAIYDEENQEYLIYWASGRTDLGQKVIQCARTRDFRTFTEPEIFMGTEYPSVIDTTMVKGDDGKYYRFTKDEEPIKVFMETADSLSGPWTRVESTVDNIYGVEGPAIFRMNDGKYCLMLDGYAGGAPQIGFFPLVTDDIASGEFTLLTEGYHMPTGAKHGVMLSITQEEYDAVMEKWGPLETDSDGSAPVLYYDFESETEGLHGSAAITEDAERGNVLTLDGQSGSYFSFPTGFFDKRDTFTLTMDFKNQTSADYFFTFGVGNSTSKYLFLRTRDSQTRTALTISGNRYEEGVDARNESLGDSWHKLALVVTPTEMKTYLDGELISTVETTKTISHLGTDLEATLGKSAFAADAYFSGSFDNVAVYNRALSEEEICGVTEITNLTKTDGRVSFNVNSSVSGEFDIYIMEYASDGSFVKAQKIEQTLAAGEEYKFDREVEGDKIKVSVWKGGTMAPVTKAAETEASEE